MKFQIIKRFDKPPYNAVNQAFLTWDNWNDYSFYTLFGLIYVDQLSVSHDIGPVKIGFFGQNETERKLAIGDSFDVIDEQCFSLGQEDDYYQNLNNLGDTLRDQILFGLKDIAKIPELFERAIEERVTTVSLLRNISPTTVTGQYRRLAFGGVRLTSYNFTFLSPKTDQYTTTMALSFAVVPESNPPTNIHILIGRNGVGKTNLINKMINSLYNRDNPHASGTFTIAGNQLFANIILVSFSAFEMTVPRLDIATEFTELKYGYIGLKKAVQTRSKHSELKTAEEITKEFTDSLAIIQSSKVARWKEAIETLESDPNFKEANVRYLADITNPKEFQDKASGLFETLSSGHKIILLTITRLVEILQEKSLIFIDEPEAHLHPPLLSAFTRALSELLIRTNGVAIVATHSPVILQEVPNSCVWKLRRAGSDAVAERLDIESFGENVGILTREVFGLEVTDSGFYRLLSQAVAETGTYEELVNHFNQQLGMEARSIARALFVDKNKPGN